MMETDLQRRQFLKLFSSVGVLATGSALFGQRAYASRDAATGNHVLLSARNDAEGGHWLAAYRMDGIEIFRTAVPLRAHDIVQHPAGDEVLFAGRRPGTECYWLDAHGGKILSVLEAREGRHFYGHGVFDPAGEYLYLTENDTREPGRGVLGVYRYRHHQLQFEAEIPTHGIGPHQLVWMPGTEHLAIANGGICTEADSRKAMNTDAMESSLVIMHREGKLLSKDTLPEQQSSIRHLAVNDDGTLVTGQQYMGDAGDDNALVAIKRPGQKLQAFPLEEMQQLNLQQYCASIAVHPGLGLMAVTTPRGNRVMAWELASSRSVLDIHLPDCSGLVAVEKGFVVSSGQRGCALLRYEKGVMAAEVLSLPSGGWDNHLAFTPVN